MSAWTYRLSNGKATPKIVPPRLRLPCWKGLAADPEEKHEPASGVHTELVDSLKALDPERPIREADMSCGFEVPWTGKDTLAAYRAETGGFSLGGNRNFAGLTLIHSVHNHTDDDGNYGTTHTTADQLTSERC